MLRPEEMAFLTEQMRQEIKKQSLAHTERRALVFTGALDDMHTSGDGTYIAKVTDEIIDLASVVRITAQTAAQPMQFDVTAENSRMEDLGGGVYMLFCQYMGMEFPTVMTATEGSNVVSGSGTYVMGFDMDGFLGWISRVDLETIYPIPQEYIPPLDALYLNGTDGVRYKLYVDAAGQLQVEVV